MGPSSRASSTMLWIGVSESMSGAFPTSRRTWGCGLRECAPTGNQAEVQRSDMALHSDVQGVAVIGNRHGKVIEHSRTGEVEADWRPRDVRDHDVGRGRKPVGKIRTPVERGKAAHDPGR